MSDAQGDQNLKTDVQPSGDGTRTSEGNMGTSCQTHATGESGAKSKSSRSGCFGFLVAVLFLEIAAVSLLPLFVSYVRRAADPPFATAVVVISNLRTRLELYRIEHDHLPGIQLDAVGAPVRNSTDGTYCVSVCGKRQTHYIQTMTGHDESNPTTNGRLAFMDALGDMQVCESGAGTQEDAHVFKRIDVNYSDLTGRRLRPNHFQYLVPYNAGENYCSVVGVFGDGRGLPAGTGYAVLDFKHVPSKTKLIATFHRYRPEGGGGRLFLLPQSGFKGVPSSGGVIIPSLDAVIHASIKEDAEKAVEAFKQALKDEWWELQ